MIYILSFLVAMGVLVGFHEYAHFITAKKLGIKVVEFSIGFGSVLYSRKGKDGVLYKLCAIPLGGYVRMLDEEDKESMKEVCGSEIHKAFNRQPLWKRFLVVFNGPASNYVLALLLFFIVGVGGINVYKPTTGEIADDSWAARNGVLVGDEFLSIGDSKVTSWSSFLLGVVDNAEQNLVPVAVHNHNLDIKRSYLVDLRGVELSKDGNALSAMGLVPAHQVYPAILGEVVSDMPGDKAGLMAGDLVLSVNGEPINSWSEMAAFVRASEGEPIGLLVERNGLESSYLVAPEKEIGGNYVVGLVSKQHTFDSSYYRSQGGDVISGMKYALDESYSIFAGTAGAIHKLVTGDIPITMMSGPIGIAKATGDTLMHGWVPYVTLIATLSISLCIMNLLPIPMLDGGHLMFYAYEFVFRRPLPEEAQRFLLSIGSLFIYGLIFFVIASDIYHMAI